MMNTWMINVVVDYIWSNNVYRNDKRKNSELGGGMLEHREMNV